MAKVFGQLDSLKTLRLELDRHNVKLFDSIREIQDFRHNYSQIRVQVENNSKESIEAQIQSSKEDLNRSLTELEQRKIQENTIIDSRLSDLYAREEKLELYESNNLIRTVLKTFRSWKINKQIKHLKTNREGVVNKKLVDINNHISRLSSEIEYLQENKEIEISIRSREELEKIDHAKSVIDELGNLIAGAIGEGRVLKELKKLPENFTVINNFQLKFSPPVYHKESGERIFSIQIDHLVISPAGIFILETKNWSQESIRSLDLRSPVEQIKRSSFALFVFINSNISFQTHHWGDKDIPIRNVLVMTGARPDQHFKYVKVKTTSDINKYLTFFEPLLSREEVEALSNRLKEHCK